MSVVISLNLPSRVGDFFISFVISSAVSREFFTTLLSLMANPTVKFNECMKQWVSYAFGSSDFCHTHLFSLHRTTAIIILFLTIFQTEIHSEENILDNCLNDIYVGNVKWMEFDKILVTIQVIFHPAYTQCKLWNVCNVGGLIDHESEKISTTIFSCNFP